MQRRSVWVIVILTAFLATSVALLPGRVRPPQIRSSPNAAPRLSALLDAGQIRKAGTHVVPFARTGTRRVDDLSTGILARCGRLCLCVRHSSPLRCGVRSKETDKILKFYRSHGFTPWSIQFFK
jgi:hypothetical protein